MPMKSHEHVNLNGQWQAAQRGTDRWYPATVPGCVHTDLLAAGRIPDPFYRDNEKEVQWVGEAEWIYRRSFDLPANLLERARVVLRCDGLDTLAAVRINGIEVGRADNMFRTWEFDAKPALKPGENIIEVSFQSPLPLMKERNASRSLYEWAGPHEPRGRAWVRKEPCNFGWDWGPVLITCGIWRGISLRAWDGARIEDLMIHQDHSKPGAVGLRVEIKAGPAAVTAAVSVAHAGRVVASASAAPSGEGAAVTLEIRDPALWWPAGMGTQPLYEVHVDLQDPSGNLIDTATRRIGLRTLRLLPPDDQNSLRFEVNGVAFFAKGANWIPADAFATRVTPEALRRYVAGAAAVNMNMLRFWGGGYYEEDALFDACDEMGICVWLDFKFACSSYPAFDGPFMENVKLEARDQLRRLRHHPCIAVWCGNNEISLMTKDAWSEQSMGRADYDRLFKDLLGGQVREHAPDANYVSGSPDCGDNHYWQVWHGDKPFSAYLTQTGFMSEFGFQSFPEPRMVRAFTDSSDRASVLTPVMRWHQRSAGDGNERIRNTTLQYFSPPKDFESALWLSQILQAYGVKLGAEHWRRTMPKSMGCLFWQYNDCWPVASWSSVDYFGRWKALHYFARRFYSPLLVCGVENPDAGTVEIHVASDCLEERRGTVVWEVTDARGKRAAHGSVPVIVPPRTAVRIQTLQLHEQLSMLGKENLFVWLHLHSEGKILSDNLITFVPPKDLQLADPQLTTKCAKSSGGFRVSVTATHPALWCWLSLDELDATYSDNFVHIVPGMPAEFEVRPARALPPEEFTAALRVRSLFDTFSHPPS